jgi:hypothetical protein
MATTEDKSVVVLPTEAKAQMSSLVLRLLLKANSTHTDRPLVSLTADDLLRRMLRLQANLHSRNMEIFHAMFETLRAELLSVVFKQHKSTLGELYPGAMVSASDASRAMLQEVIPLRVRQLEEEKHRVTKHLSKKWCEARMNRVIVPASGNEGFDIAIPLDGDRLLVIDTKYSTPRDDDGKAKLDATEHVKGPRNRLDECLSAIQGTPSAECTCRLVL